MLLVQKENHFNVHIPIYPFDPVAFHFFFVLCRGRTARTPSLTRDRDGHMCIFNGRGKSALKSLHLFTPLNGGENLTEGEVCGVVDLIVFFFVICLLNF